MNNIKLTSLALAASVAMGAIGSLTAATAANAGSGIFKNATFGIGYTKRRYPSNKHACKVYKIRYDRTGDRYWLGEYYRCLHSFDDDH